jgi:hypothetical protein
MRVQANHEYYYVPNLLDIADARTDLKTGALVTVVNLPGAPKCNTMGHCHVNYQGEFAGLVHTNSLHTKAEYVEYLKQQIAKHEAHV